MKRDVLTDAVRRAAEELGYAFHTGPDRLIPARVAALPALWLSPVKLTASEGRRECTDNYRINIYFMAASLPGARGNAEPVLAVLEADAAELCRRLGADENIRRTYDLGCSPVLAAFTKDGEVAMAAEFHAELHYCK